MHVVASFTFGQQLVLNIAGPLLSAFLIAIVGASIARRAQDRRDQQIRETETRQHDRELEAQRLQDEHALRERLIDKTIDAASALYLATQHYWRAKKEHMADTDLRSFRTELDQRYLESRRTGLTLEQLLQLHFKDEKPKLLCHRIMDLLTVRYFQLVGRDGASQNLRERNEGEAHTGLSAAELADPTTVLRKYHATLEELVEAVVTGTLVLESVGTNQLLNPDD